MTERHPARHDPRLEEVAVRHPFEGPPTENEVTVVLPDGERPIPRATKAQVARAILDIVLSRRSSASVRV